MPFCLLGRYQPHTQSIVTVLPVTSGRCCRNWSMSFIVKSEAKSVKGQKQSGAWRSHPALNQSYRYITRTMMRLGSAIS